MTAALVTALNEIDETLGGVHDAMKELCDQGDAQEKLLDNIDDQLVNISEHLSTIAQQMTLANQIALAKLSRHYPNHSLIKKNEAK